MSQSNKLIIDDNHDLENEGYRVTAAYNAADGIDEFYKGFFDMAFLKLKQRGCAVKTIIVTGYAKEESDSINVLKSMSVTGCMFKPFNPEDMLHAIERITDG